MKKSLNKSLIVAIVAAILSFVCAIVSFGYSSEAFADETLTVPTTYTTAGETEFYLYDGAAVRVESSGISFKSYVTAGFHNKISENGTKTVTYYATANAVGKKAMALKFPIQPDFSSEDTVELRTYINFLSLEDDSAAAIAAYAVDFATSSYARVDNGDGSYTYYRAFSEAKKGDNDITRSMRAVGNQAYLEWESEAINGYPKNTLKKYFTEGERDVINGKQITSAYLFEDGSAYVDMPGVSEKTVILYNGAKPLGEYTYNAEKGVYEGALPGVEAGDYINAFVDGKVYTTVAADATKIVDLEGFKALQTVDDYSVNVLDADINMSGVSWSPAQTSAKNGFKGVFDGLQHKVYNFTVKQGLFGYVSEAVVKNLHVEVAGFASGKLQGVLTGRSHNSIFENIYVDVLSHNLTSGNCASVFAGVTASGGTTHIIDSAFVLRSKANAQYAYTDGADSLLLTRKEGQTNVVNSYVIDATSYKLPLVGADFGNKFLIESKEYDENTTYNKLVHGIFDFDETLLANDFLKENFALTKNTFAKIELTQENFESVLEGATSGYYVLTEDIDMKDMTWAPTGGSFTGTIDGQGNAIKNFTAPSGHAGLLPHVSGVVIKNLNLHAKTNTGKGVVAGQVKGPVFVENCVFNIDKIDSANSGLFNVVQGQITVNNVVVNYKAAGNYSGMGFIAGREASSYNVKVSNCYFASNDGMIKNVFVGDNFAINYEEDGTTVKSVSEGTVGIDNLPAVEGEDYKVYANSNALFDAIAEGKLPENLTKGAAKVGMVTPLTAKNLSDIQSAYTGYFYLAEDIDMSGVTWNCYPGASYNANIAFSGVLNGAYHTIDNFTTGSTSQLGGLFRYMNNATVKNIAFTNATVTPGTQGLLARDFRGNSVLENVYVHAKSVHGSAGVLFAAFESSNANAKLKDVTVVVDSGAASFINSAHFVSPLILDNCYFVGPEGKKLTYNASSSGVVSGVEGTDYFVYSDRVALAKDVLGNKTSMTKFVADAFMDNQVTLISQENIRDLETTTSGVILLTEDIDMDGITNWAPTAGFAAILDGNGHTIKNFTAPAGYVGLVGNTAAGATFQNLTLHAKKNTDRAVLTGQVKGATTVTNCKFIVDKLTGNYSSVISNVVQGPLTVKDTYIAIADSADNFPLTGIIAGGEAASYNVVVSNVYAFSVAGNITNMFKGDNNDDATLKETTVGTDGALAVNGEDYFLYASDEELIAALEAGTINANFKAWLEEINFIKAVSNANFAEMQNGTKGYWYLTEDIDMSTIDFNGEKEGLGYYNPGASNLYGTFDGKNHTIEGFVLGDAASIALFVSADGHTTIKNLVLKAGEIQYNNNSVLVTSFRGTDNLVENVVIDVEKFSALAGGIIARNLAGSVKNSTVTLSDVMIIVRDSLANADNGLLFGNYKAADTATLDGLYIVDLATAEGKITQLDNGLPQYLAVGGATAELGKDYFRVTSISDLDASAISTELLALIEVANPGFFG